MNLLRYGWEHPCLRCGVHDLPNHEVTSERKVEDRANRLLELLEPLCRTGGRMLGLLYVDGSWVLALSGAAAVPQELHDTVEQFDPDMATIAHDRYEVPTRSLGGHAIGEFLLAHRRLEPSRPARWPGCYCAAPKLLSYWTQPTQRAYARPAVIHMVEVWCGRETKTRRHGQRAHSCATCGRVLSTLMCRADR